MMRQANHQEIYLSEEKKINFASLKTFDSNICGTQFGHKAFQLKYAVHIYIYKTIIIITMPRIYSENNEHINKLSKEIFFGRLHYFGRINTHTVKG